MSIIRGVAIVLAATVLGGDAVQAQEPGRLANRMFDRIDTDRDGVLTRPEVQAARSRMFDRIDTDRDGALTAAEAEAARVRAAGRSERLAGMQGQRLATLDRNHDGLVSRDEFVAGTGWFDRMDTTGRGVTKAQFAALISQPR